MVLEAHVGRTGARGVPGIGNPVPPLLTGSGSTPSRVVMNEVHQSRTRYGGFAVHVTVPSVTVEPGTHGLGAGHAGGAAPVVPATVQMYEKPFVACGTTIAPAEYAVELCHCGMFCGGTFRTESLVVSCSR